ncbi:Lactose permease [Colletotrichum siamense]|uniref:Lactose permease n=1 Tax=Colletotrichum siamense TaxID=690259 RepID=UPI0018726C76|nr:Lactose permease [Colletotrichum siamense]KAF5510520.1 Lactose permease [Colletotrichum siamense]
MIRNALGRGAKRVQAQSAQAEAPQFAEVTWWKDPGLRKLYFWCAILMAMSASTGFDAKLMNTSQVMDQWQTSFEHPTGGRLGIIVAILDIGSLCSFWMVPFFADNYGRKVPIIIGCVIETIGAFIGAFSSSQGMYMAGRFILGFGSSFNGAGLLIAEIAHPQHRAKISAIVNCMYGVGSTFCAWLALGTIKISTEWSWRSLTILQAFPGLLVLSLIWWIPESPRWLIAKERYEEAEQMLAKYHGNGDRTNETVAFEFREMKQTLALEFQHGRSSSYLDFARYAGNRYRVVILISLAMVSQYSGTNLFSNYANKIYEGAGIKDQTSKVLLSGGQTLMSLVVSVGFSLTIDRFGRRPLFLTATTGMVFMYMGWTIVSSQYERTHDLGRFGYPQIAFIWLFSLSYQIAWTGIMAAYALEIMPYSLRAKAGVISTIFVKGLIVLGSYTNPIAWDNFTAAGHAWVLAMFYTILDFCYLLFVYFFYPETKNLTLEEVARVFDGDDAKVARVDIQEVKKELEEEQKKGAQVDVKVL